MPLVLADEAFLVVGAVGATLVGMLWALNELFSNRAKERTKREIAAYVAEGSITPQDGARLMRAAGKQAVDIEKELG